MAKKNADTVIVADAGRKRNAEAKDLQSIITKAEWEMRKNDALCANDLPALYKLQRDIALGINELGKKASITNRKSAIENMIVRGEAYATGEAPLLNIQDGGVVTPEKEVVESKQVGNGEPVLSLDQKREQWKILQAEKKLKEK